MMGFWCSLQVPGVGNKNVGDVLRVQRNAPQVQNVEELASWDGLDAFRDEILTLAAAERSATLWALRWACATCGCVYTNINTAFPSFTSSSTSFHEAVPGPRRIDCHNCATTFWTPEQVASLRSLSLVLSRARADSISSFWAAFVLDHAPHHVLWSPDAEHRFRAVDQAEATRSKLWRNTEDAKRILEEQKRRSAFGVQRR
jgi:hypothetical protein